MLRGSSSWAVAPIRPSRTGLRRSHPGSFEAAQEIRDGRLFDIERTTRAHRSELARTRCGRVAIANADAVWTPPASAAISQAHRAVGELVVD
jgi:hypothetical protein